MTQGFKMLEAGRVDAAACALPGCEQAIRDAHSNPAELDFIAVDETVLSVLVPRSSPLAADQAAMARLRSACERSPPDAGSLP
jgi:polar amino acid transport system substrate-binding protein